MQMLNVLVVMLFLMRRAGFGPLQALKFARDIVKRGDVVIVDSETDEVLKEVH